jgi:hypothetical protein
MWSAPFACLALRGLSVTTLAVIRSFIRLLALLESMTKSSAHTSAFLYVCLCVNGWEKDSEPSRCLVLASSRCSLVGQNGTAPAPDPAALSGTSTSLYGNNMDCLWRVLSGDPGQRIVADFAVLSIQTLLSNLCVFDSLQVSDSPGLPDNYLASSTPIVSLNGDGVGTVGAGCWRVGKGSLLWKLGRTGLYGRTGLVFQQALHAVPHALHACPNPINLQVLCGNQSRIQYLSSGPSLDLRFTSDLSITAAGFNVTLFGEARPYLCETAALVCME